MSDDPFIMKEIKSHLVSFREAFELFDRSGTGEVTSVEFTRSWRHFGFEASVEEVDAMLTAADTDNSGKMDFMEFVFMVANSTGEISSQIQMQLQEVCIKARSQISCCSCMLLHSAFILCSCN